MAYATEQDLADYLGVDIQDLPADAERLLERASEDIDYYTLERIDAENAEHLDAAKKAVCAQVEMWIEVGEETDIRGALASFSIGRWSATYASGSNGGGPPKLAPRARRYLLVAGLLYRGVAMV